MKKINYFFCLVTLLVWSCQSPQTDIDAPQKGNTYHLFYLGGQSNMEGFGFNSDLPKSKAAPLNNVLIFHSTPRKDSTEVDGKGIWNNLQPGHGIGFSTNGESNNYSERFGPELSFGQRLAELMPGKKIALIKYAKGGSSIALHSSTWGSWDPDFNDVNGINQFDHFLATMRNAFSHSDIDGDGAEDKLIPCGIAWMQGEADAHFTEEVALKYGDNLKRLMDLIRTSMLEDDLPVVISRITDSGQDEDGKLMDHCEIVQKAQAEYAEKEVNATFIKTTADCEFLEDGWHYKSDCYLKMGEEMADELFKLMNK